MTNIFQKLFQRSISSTLTVTSSNGFHLRPIAKFVNEAKKYDATITLLAHNKEVSATQVPKILSLGLEKGDTFSLQTMGKEAEKASAELYDFFMQLMIEDKEIEEIKQEKETYEGSTLKGKTIAKGIAIASMVKYEVVQHFHNKELPIFHAIDLTRTELSLEYERNKIKDEAQIFLAQKELLSSELFNQNFEDSKAFKSIINNEIEILKGSKFESRIADYLDIEKKVLSFVGVFSDIKVPNTPYILLTDDLLPSEISELADTPIQGVILQKGTPTSHASILLRSFAIPSVIINSNITLSPKAILDANSGNLILEPTENDIKKAKNKQQVFQLQQEQSHQRRFEPLLTKDGKKIKVLANITDLNSAKEAKELGADGVGLLRTEFLFTQKKPSIKEQTQAYSNIFELFDELTVRTLDIGGDKSLPYIKIAKEDNPFLGVRGIRFSLQEQTLFKEQLLAIGLASTNAKNKVIKIMFPMVSSTEEFTQAKAIALEVYQKNNIDISNIQFGIMLEVPSVIFALEDFNKLVDFYSIGTNDLTQYLFAIERTHPTLQVDVSSPILMNALKQILANTSKPISICGELAGLEKATSQLIKIGYKNLSISAKLIPSIKEKIRNL